ncbi:hypothetical protein JKP88DRAFT_254332 [Tribonema minus]|uniref:Uncharacterized protein n=1 Tax=Tribonema minus TaxID=303371 RepID=A0A835ZAV5_9STRA|nr:hypothetical protein JKP88DRAFT_254332 [Tribonema minus]
MAQGTHSRKQLRHAAMSMLAAPEWSHAVDHVHPASVAPPREHQAVQIAVGTGDGQVADFELSPERYYVNGRPRVRAWFLPLDKDLEAPEITQDMIDRCTTEHAMRIVEASQAIFAKNCAKNLSEARICEQMQLAAQQRFNEDEQRAAQQTKCQGAKTQHTVDGDSSAVKASTIPHPQPGQTHKVGGCKRAANGERDADAARKRKMSTCSSGSEQPQAVAVCDAVNASTVDDSEHQPQSTTSLTEADFVAFDPLTLDLGTIPDPCSTDAAAEVSKLHDAQLTLMDRVRQVRAKQVAHEKMLAEQGSMLRANHAMLQALCRKFRVPVATASIDEGPG